MTTDRRTVFLSGWQSNPNPSPALGTARSILQAWPSTRIEAVDYSTLPTGLSADFIAKRHILPSWDYVDLPLIAEALETMTTSQFGVYISGLDLETQVLAREGKNESVGMLVPPMSALEAIRKPAHAAAARLGIETPRTGRFTRLSEAVRFCEVVGWPVWVKGVNYEATLVRTSSGLERAILAVKETWGMEVLIQEDVRGLEESVAFSAYSGSLLGTSYMRKTDVTKEGKTWGGRIGEVPDDLRDALGTLLRESGWTGGGEVEMIRSRHSGKLHLIDFNPRFPAWIHGSTLAGVNLPAMLLGAAWGEPYQVPRTPENRDFVRLVLEVSAFAPREFRQDDSAQIIETDSKGHPSGMPALSRRLAADFSPSEMPALLSQLDDRMLQIDKLVAGWSDERQGPETIPVLDEPAPLFVGFNELLSTLQALHPTLELAGAYSVKTNPDPAILRAAHDVGLGAEAISLLEVQSAIASGFEPSSIVLNGPGKWWPITLLDKYNDFDQVNCDSVEDLEVTLGLIAERRIKMRTLGIRLAPIETPSRFGIRVSEPAVFARLCEVLSNRSPSKLGLHFHLSPLAVGDSQWGREFDAALSFARSIETATGHQFNNIDLGGGWRRIPSPEVRETLNAAITLATRRLDGITRVVLEPGRAIAEPSMAVATRVLQIRDAERRAIVVSASIAEIPEAMAYPHPVWWRSSATQQWIELQDGPDQILGRTCMERDVLRTGISLPLELMNGDILAFMDAGAYDRSMSYEFGRGANGS